MKPFTRSPPRAFQPNQENVTTVYSKLQLAMFSCLRCCFKLSLIRKRRELHFIAAHCKFSSYLHLHLHLHPTLEPFQWRAISFFQLFFSTLSLARSAKLREEKRREVGEWNHDKERRNESGDVIVAEPEKKKKKNSSSCLTEPSFMFQLIACFSSPSFVGVLSVVTLFRCN